MIGRELETDAHRAVAGLRRAKIVGLAGGFATILLTAAAVGLWYAHLCGSCRVAPQVAQPTTIPAPPPLPPKALDRIAQSVE